MPQKLVLTPRELDEIHLAQFYATYLHHGTASHNQLMLIATLSKYIGIILDSSGDFTLPVDVEILEIKR